MTLDEFQLLADAWGADVSRWPEHLRAAAATLAQTSEAEAILAEAQHIDQLIVGARPEVSEERVGPAMLKVTSIVDATISAASRRTGFDKMFGLPWWSISAASVVCAAILGMWLGVVKPLNAFRGSAHPPLLTTMLDDGLIDPSWVLQ